MGLITRPLWFLGSTMAFSLEAHKQSPAKKRRRISQSHPQQVVNNPYSDPDAIHSSTINVEVDAEDALELRRKVERRIVHIPFDSLSSSSLHAKKVDDGGQEGLKKVIIAVDGNDKKGLKNVKKAVDSDNQGGLVNAVHGDDREELKNVKKAVDGDDQDELMNSVYDDDQEELKNVKKAVNGDDQESINKADDDQEGLKKPVDGDSQVELNSIKKAVNGDQEEGLQNVQKAVDVDDQEEGLKKVKKAVDGDEEELKNAKKVVDNDHQGGLKNVGLCDPGPIPDDSYLLDLLLNIEPSFLDDLYDDLPDE